MAWIPSATQARKLAFWLSFGALGIPYWLLPYNVLSLPNALFNMGAAALLLAALFLKGFCAMPLRDAILIPAAAAPAVVIVRVVVEVFLVSDSHNLWPFELIIACLFGLLVAGMGGIAGILIAWVRRASHTTD